MSGIERHRTALHRTDLSRPVRLALNDGVLTSQKSFFDYGCGRGADIRHLVRRGFDADGWDPVHRPGDQRAADVVNLGYVVNVIEDPDERLATLQNAWRLTREVLVVAARLDADRRHWLGPNLGDGTLTRLGTFQKYFAQNELTEWVNEATGEAALAAGPGVLYVFRDPARRETFAAAQFRSRGRRLPIAASVDLYRENRAALDALAEFYCDRGRLPRVEEFLEYDSLVDTFGSVRRAARLLRGLVGADRWDGVRRERSADLLVYLALARFRGRPRLLALPQALQRDIRSLFSTYKFVCATADTLLFRAGDADAIDKSCRSSPVGKITPTALYFHESALPTLSPVLRVYEGCARSYLGAVEGANVIKLYRRESKVSYLSYPEFDRDPHPGLHQSVSVCLQSLNVKVRHYAQNPPILHRKELLVATSYPRRATFARLTAQEERRGLYSRIAIPGTTKEWLTMVQACRLRYRGHRLVTAPEVDTDNLRVCRQGPQGLSAKRR